MVKTFYLLPYSPTQFELALRPGIKTVCNARVVARYVAKFLTNLGQRIIVLKATTLAPMNQKIRVQQVGLTC
jgi:hypothetical protein